MPTVVCPVEGFEEVSITFPDSDAWKVGHRDKYIKGLLEAPEGVTANTKEMYGAVFLCDAITGLDLSEGIINQPIHYLSCLEWIRIAVMTPFVAAQAPKKNGKSQQQSTE
jgi:hypothetical protein